MHLYGVYHIHIDSLLLCYYCATTSSSKQIMIESCNVNIHNLPYSDRYFNIDKQIDMLSRGKGHGHDT